MVLKKIKRIVTIIGIILSFYILDFGYRMLIYNDVNYYNVFKISPNLFTLAYISIFIGLLYLMNSTVRKILYVAIDIMFCMITFIEYGQISLGIIIVCLLSLIITLLNVYFMNNKEEKINIYKTLFIVLVCLICFIFFRGIASLSLGPEVITTSGKIEDSPRNVYLYEVDETKKQEVSGIYEYTFRDLFDNLNEKLDNNIKRINDKY